METKGLNIGSQRWQSTSFPSRIEYGVNCSGNPGRDWIPPHQVRGKLSQAGNDKLNSMFVVMYDIRVMPDIDR